MKFIERGLSELRTRLWSSDSKSIKDLKLEILKLDSLSQKELTLKTRLNTIKPYFEKAVTENKVPVPIGLSDEQLFFGISKYFGDDVLAALVDSKLIVFDFDYVNRAESDSLPDYLRKMARAEGWKE